MMTADTIYEIIAQGLAYIALSWCVIFVFRLFLVAPFVIYKDGEWHGQKFVYLEPKLAVHAYVSEETNNKLFPFRFTDAPPFSVIYYKFEIDAPSDFLSLIVIANPSQWSDFSGPADLFYTKGGIRVNRKREMFLKTFVRPNATPFSIRVYVTAWGTGPDSEKNTYERGWTVIHRRAR